MRSKRIVAAVVATSITGSALLAACGSGSSGEQVSLSPAGERGKQVAKEQGCISCHSADGTKMTGPTWEGLAGSEVELKDGTTVTADDDYLTEAIVAPKERVVDGYSPIMPTYEGEVTDAEIADLLAYLHDLAPSDAASS